MGAQAASETLVEFQNRKGQRLRGVVHLPGEAAARSPGVVFFHGFTGSRMEVHWMFVKCARALSRAGIASLRFDFAGSGESEGEFARASLQSEIDDAHDAVAFFGQHGGIDAARLGLCGLSLGGSIAATTAQGAGAKAI